MTLDQKNQIKELVSQRIADTKLSNNVAATQIGVSPAMLSHLLNNKHEHLGDKTWMRFAHWVNHNTSKQWTILNLPNFKNISSLCKDAKSNHRFLAVAGETGLGKTTALRNYVSKNENSFYTLATITMGRKEFLSAIQRSIGLDTDGSLHKRIYSIINRLKSMESPLLILDDCGKLNDGCLRLIQVIFDELEGHIGLVLSGTNAFRNYINKMATKDKIGFRELKRRVGYWLPMSEVTNAIVGQIAKSYGVEETAAVVYLAGHCKDLGSLKESLLNYQRVVDLYKAEGKMLVKTQREILVDLSVHSIIEAA